MTRSRTIGWCSMFVLMLGGVAFADERDPDRSRDSKGDDWRTLSEGRECIECPVRTIQRGERSNYHFDDPGFLGLNAVIRDPWSWERFWQQHSNGNVAPPPVDFRRWHVLVAVQGVQTSSCGPSIAITGVQRCGPAVLVRIIDDETPGACDALSNPFHIVRVPLRCLGATTSIGFLSHAPGPIPGAVAGRVMGETEDGTLIPLARAVVRLTPPDDPGVVAEAFTNDDGFYHIHAVPPGDYAASAFARGFHPVLGEPIHVPPGETVERDFVLHPAQDERGAIVGQVRGGLSWDESERLPCARVLLFIRPPDPDHPGPVRVERTDCDGVYRFLDLAPGDYHLVAEAEGFLSQSADVFLPPDEHVLEQHFLLHPLE